MNNNKRSVRIGGDISTEEKLSIGEVFAQRVIDDRLADYAARMIKDGADEAEVLAFVDQQRVEYHQALNLQLAEFLGEIEDDRDATRH
jgi:hypothetical protein